jgi:hypothetical protein
MEIRRGSRWYLDAVGTPLFRKDSALILLALFSGINLGFSTKTRKVILMLSKIGRRAAVGLAGGLLSQAKNSNNRRNNNHINRGPCLHNSF